jgi:drug/metabolite transporter (DMT)-like permease
LLPESAAVFGFLLLGQTPTGVDFVGMALVLGGVAIQEREVIERHPREAPNT